MVRYIIIFVIIILVAIAIALHFLVIHELRDLVDDFSRTYGDFQDEMILLADTLKVYHELLKDYQIPMIPIPIKENNSGNDW